MSLNLVARSDAHTVTCFHLIAFRDARINILWCARCDAFVLQSTGGGVPSPFPTVAMRARMRFRPGNSMPAGSHHRFQRANTPI